MAGRRCLLLTVSGAAGRCDSALVVANAGQMLAPGEALGAMVIGGCPEQDGRYDLAYATYADFASRYPEARGIAAVRALARSGTSTTIPVGP